MSLGRSARSPFPARTPTPTANRTRPQRPKKESRQTPSRGDCRIHAAKELSAAARSQAVQAEQSERGVKGVYLRRSSPSSVTEFAGAHNDLRHSDPRPARAISTLTSREEQSKAACTCDCATPSRTLIPARGTRERPGPREAARKRRDRALTSRRHRYTAAHSYAPEAPLCPRRAGD